MGNKILTLFDMEFKRVQKLYFLMLSLLTMGNIGIFILGVYRAILDVRVERGLKVGISILKEEIGQHMLLRFQLSTFIYDLSSMIFAICIIACLLYSFFIWYRDFHGKSKSIYTLLMLPENRFIIFISKFITMIALFFGVILTQYLCWAVYIFILSKYTNMPFMDMLESMKNLRELTYMFGFNIIICPVEFLVKIILTAIVAISTLFTTSLIFLSKRKVGWILGTIYAVVIFITYVIVNVGAYEFSDLALKINILLSLGIIVLSIAQSYNLLKNKVYE